MLKVHREKPEVVVRYNPIKLVDNGSPHHSEETSPPIDTQTLHNISFSLSPSD